MPTRPPPHPTPPPRPPRALRCELTTEADGIDVDAPRLAWTLPDTGRSAGQTACHVRVTHGPTGHVTWDSGVVEQHATSLSLAAPLRPLTRYAWQARFRDRSRRWSDWSAPATFTTGLREDAPTVRWFGLEDASPAATYLRATFTLERPARRAVAAYATLGCGDLTLDGHLLTDSTLDPAFTRYDRTVFYRVARVDTPLAAGEHVLAATLGHGFYHLQTPDFFGYEHAAWTGAPRLFALLEVEFGDGATVRVGPDLTWYARRGPITFNCVRGGESVDARVDLGAWRTRPGVLPGWPTASPLPAPSGRLAAQLLPPVRVSELIEPARVTEPRAGTVVVDFGRNLAGWTRLEVAGDVGQTLTLDHHAALTPDGLVDRARHDVVSHTYGRYQHQRCVLSGAEPDVFEPRLTYHGFRYVEIGGLKTRAQLRSIRAARAHTDLGRGGHFTCSDPELDRLHDAARRTLEDCTFGSPCAEPVREKISWNGDTFFTRDAHFYLFVHAPQLYRKNVHDVIDAQDADGHVPPITPGGVWGHTDGGRERVFWDDPWWGGSLAEIVDGLWTHYGDDRTLALAYDACRRYLRYVAGTAREGLVEWSLGDWMDEAWNELPGHTSVGLTGTLALLRQATLLERFARRLGRVNDVPEYRRLARQARRAVRARFLDADTGQVDRGSQTAQALSVWTGAVTPDERPRVLARLADALRAADGHLTTGFVGLMPTLSVLSDFGLGDLAFDAVTKPHGSGWFQQLRGDYPTLGENIHPRLTYGTGHHQFSACIAGWLYRGLAGLRPLARTPGFTHFDVRPVVPRALDAVEASIVTPAGRVESAWRRDGDVLTLCVGVPGGATATVHVPAEGGDVRVTSADARRVTSGGHAPRFHVGSGVHRFHVTP